MDFYRFINSKDIRAHLESIGYQFNTLEAAWLVYQCRTATMKERHAAWQEIIDTMPDADMPFKQEDPPKSLHAFLRAYMALEDRFLQEFHSTEGAHAYNYYEPEYFCEPAPCDLLVDHRGIYHDLDYCLSAALAASEGHYEAIVYRIDLLTGDRIHAVFNPTGYVLRVRPEYRLFLTDEEIFRDSFVALTNTLSFPLPFHRGTILYDAAIGANTVLEENETHANAWAMSLEYCRHEVPVRITKKLRDKSRFPGAMSSPDRDFGNDNGEKNELISLMAGLAVKTGFPFRFDPPAGTPKKRQSDGFFGVRRLDRNSEGNYESDLIGLASFSGRASSERDTFLLRFILHHAIAREETIVFFSLRYKTPEIWKRLLATLSGRDPAAADRFSPEDLDRLWKAYFELLRSGLHIVDSPETDTKTVDLYLQSNKPDLVIVDGLQQINPVAELEDQRIRVQYVQLVYSLKEIAKERRVPVLLTSGLYWPTGFVPGQHPEPTLRDFDRVVGNQDFDHILLINDLQDTTNGDAEISLVKNRYGRCVDVWVDNNCI